MKLAIIGDRETVSGFALGGVSCRYVVDDLLAAEKALTLVMQDESIAVLLITTKFARNLDTEIEKWKNFRPVYPLVVEIQPRRGGEKGTDRMNELIRRAVGITIEQDDAKNGER